MTIFTFTVNSWLSLLSLTVDFHFFTLYSHFPFCCYFHSVFLNTLFILNSHTHIQLYIIITITIFIIVIILFTFLFQFPNSTLQQKDDIKIVDFSQAFILIIFIIAANIFTFSKKTTSRQLTLTKPSLSSYSSLQQIFFTFTFSKKTTSR